MDIDTVERLARLAPLIPYIIQATYNELCKEIEERARKDGLEEKVKQRLKEEGLLE